MRLDPRKDVNEEFTDLPPDLPPEPLYPMYPGYQPYPGYPFLPPPVSTPDDAPRPFPVGHPYNPFPFPYDPDNFDPIDIPLDLDPRLIPYLPTSPELRRARERERNRKPEPVLPPDFPPEADKNGDGRLSKEELADYIILLARDVGLPDSIIAILIKYLEGRANPLEMFRLSFYIEQIKELLRRIRGEIDPSFFPFDIPEPEDLPFPFN